MEDMQSINVPPAGESGLFLTTFGHSVTGPGHRYGPAVRSYHLIHFILAGKGTFQANQHTYHLRAGQGFLIEPDYQTTYESDADDPWTYIWVAFNGSRAPEIIASLRLSQAEPIYTCTKEQGAKLTAYVQDMLAHNSFTLPGRYYRLGLLMQFLSVLAEAQRDLLPPALRLPMILHPWVAFCIMPIFALANAGVQFSGIDLSAAAPQTTAMAVLVALVLGKPLGVFICTWLAVKSGLCSLPEGLNWRGVLLVGLLAGIGFTMSIFVGGLAFADAKLLGAAKLGILAGSAIAALLGLGYGFAMRKRLRRA